MKALGGSYLKFFTCKQRGKESAVWWSRGIAPSRHESGFLGHQKRGTDGFSLAISFQQKCISSISADASAQTNVESEEIQTIYSDELKTVRVRFMLHKECAFGQHFFIVGDDPILGLWDPTEGVPLTWSEGHVWSAEIDLPFGKEIKYKFILKGDAENISWQPGPDRILETRETEKIIIVSEDWDNHELQNIVLEEEIIISDLNEEALIDSDVLIVAENLKEPISDEGINDMIMKIDNANGHLVAENIIGEKLEGQYSSLSGEETDLMNVTELKNEEKGNLVINGSNLLSSEDQMRDEGVPVLVPGLVPMPHEEIEEVEVNEVENKSVENTKSGFEEIEDISTEAELEPEPVPMPELTDEEYVSASQDYTETSEKSMIMMVVDENVQKQMHGKDQQMENNIMESDMQWGRRTIQKFLANLGFL